MKLAKITRLALFCAGLGADVIGCDAALIVSPHFLV
jgi:hypothetical protein